MRLFHFSEDAGIERFVPRPVAVPSARAPGREWLNGPLVWAIEEARDYLYLFPRECPRIVIWARPETTQADRAEWLGDHAGVAFVEHGWRDRLLAAVVQRYELAPESFESLDDAGMWVSREPVEPIRREALGGLDRQLAARRIDLRFVETLAPLRRLWRTSLHASGIRLRNAA